MNEATPGRFTVRSANTTGSPTGKLVYPGTNARTVHIRYIHEPKPKPTWWQRLWKKR